MANAEFYFIFDTIFAKNLTLQDVLNSTTCTSTYISPMFTLGYIDFKTGLAKDAAYTVQ
jgi:hypothetical protein